MPEVDVTKQLLIDFDNDGIVSPAGANEDVTTYIRQGTPLRMRYGRDQIKELSPLAAGFVEGVLDNQSLIFSDDNATSPVYGQVVANRLVIANAKMTAGYRQTVLNDVPTGYYRHGEASGTTATDASGSGNDLTYTATGVTLVQPGAIATELDGTSNTAVAFASASSGAATKANFGVNQAAYSIECWVKGAPAIDKGLAGAWSANTGAFLWLGSGTGEIALAHGAPIRLRSGIQISATAWTHVVATYDGTNCRLYVNGVLAAGPSAAAAPGGAANTFEVGRYGGGHNFDGTLDEVAVYPTDLSAARVLAHYNAGRDQRNADLATYQTGAGYLQFPEEHPIRTEQNIRFVAYDALGRFNTQDVETAMFTNIATGAAIGKVLDAMGWPAGKRRIDTGITTMTRWRATGAKGFQHIRELVLTEGPPAIAYIDLTTEEFVFEDRHYRWLTTRCVTSQVIFRDTGTEPCYSQSDPKAPADNIVNDVTVQVRSWASTPGQALIVGGPTLPLALAAGQSFAFPVTTNADAFDTAVASVTTTSGSQTNGFDRTSGKKATLTVTAGASGCVISAVGVTATTYAISTTPVSNTVTTAVQASRDKYGTKTLPSELVPLWLPASDALPYCDYVASRYQERVRQNLIGLNNGDTARALQGLTRKVSDRVTINDSRTGSSDDYFIEQREIQLQPGSNLAAYLGCEKASAQSYWRLGVAGYSELGVTTRLIFAFAGICFVYLSALMAAPVPVVA